MDLAKSGWDNYAESDDCLCKAERDCDPLVAPGAFTVGALL
jgi:hypothetical protein